MNLSSTFSGVANIVVCGISQSTSVFVQKILLSHQSINVCGFWNGWETPDFDINGLRRIAGGFEDVLNEPDLDFIFLCHSPQVQFKILKSFFLQRNVADSNKSFSKSPVVVLIPPVSPCYDLGLILNREIPMGIAMPLRKLFPVSLLASHLKNLRDRKPLDSVRNPSGLPAHWLLGTPRSFHARLSTTSSVRSSNYSWLCEPGVMGGGLINLYGAGLIDLAFILTGGLQLTSVNCVSRVFDWKISDDPSCIRRVSAEDYVVITGELEANDCGTIFGKGAPVAVFSISSELPPTNSDEEFTEDFRLHIELIGSSGRFVVPEGGNRITWTPVKPLSSLSSSSEGHNIPVPGTENEELFIKEKNRPKFEKAKDETNAGLANIPVLNGTVHSLPPDDYDSSTIQSTPLISVSTVAHNTETVTLRAKVNGDSSQRSHPLGLAWSQWLSQLANCVQPNRTKLNVDSLVATPEHWGYVQRVLTALEKSSRLRCWVDVVTGERM